MASHSASVSRSCSPGGSAAASSAKVMGWPCSASVCKVRCTRASRSSPSNACQNSLSIWPRSVYWVVSSSAACAPPSSDLVRSRSTNGTLPSATPTGGSGALWRRTAWRCQSMRSACSSTSLSNCPTRWFSAAWPVFMNWLTSRSLRARTACTTLASLMSCCTSRRSVLCCSPSRALSAAGWSRIWRMRWRISVNSVWWDSCW